MYLFNRSSFERLPFFRNLSLYLSRKCEVKCFNDLLSFSTRCRLGMKKFVQAGHYLGEVPIGYDHYGPRVVDPSKRDIRQKIVINDTGIKLRKAWEWKLQGFDDVHIIRKLESVGVKITKQNAGYTRVVSLKGSRLKVSGMHLFPKRFFRGPRHS